jgi:hypothetical protein
MLRDPSDASQRVAWIAAFLIGRVMLAMLAMLVYYKE